MTSLVASEPLATTPPAASPRWIVGHDGSDGATTALQWVGSHAERLGAEIELVRAWQYPFYDLLPASSWSVSSALAQDLERGIREELADIAGLALADKVVTASADAALGPTVDVLTARAASADLLVVGSRGLGGVGRFALGSVSHRLACHAPGPLLLVPESATPRRVGRVVVGVDGSPGSQAALRWALSFAPGDAEILAVLGWTDGDGAAGDLDEVTEHLRSAARKRFESAVAAVAAETGADDRIDHQFAVGRGRTILSAFAVDTDLLVVGARSRTGVTGAITGSTATWLAHHLRVPTAIVPARSGGVP